MFQVSSKDGWSKTISHFEKIARGDIFKNLSPYGDRGVDALSLASPVDTGLLSQSWGYSIYKGRGIYAIDWWNDDIEGGMHIAIVVQYGHGARDGSRVVGRDYINPAMRPVFDDIADDIWRQVTA